MPATILDLYSRVTRWPRGRWLFSRMVCPWLLYLILVVLASGSPAFAQEGRASIRGAEQTLNSRSFLDSHPDIKHRLEGWTAYEDGRHDEALKDFIRSARYADKLSQAMLAEMHWLGKGTPENRPLAYAWADLAAERGYPKLVMLREKYWAGLDHAGQAQALELGAALYAEYGDDVAKPRMDRYLRQARRNMISKRPRRDIWIVVQDHSGQWFEIQGHHFYNPKYWDPKLYHEWADETWATPPHGKVEIGDLVPVRP